MIRPLRLWPDPVLSLVCPQVTVFDANLQRLADDMLETMYAAQGRGLAAPQVGESLRLFVMDVTWKDAEPEPLVCVNPVIVSASDDTTAFEEGCLSIPGIPATVTRPAQILLRWQDINGAGHEAQMTGLRAVCAQHELDHLDGIVIFDRIDPDLRATLETGYLNR